MRWFEHPEIVSYIIDSYATTEIKGHHTRRVFQWQTGGVTVRGNVEAFFDHLKAHFLLEVSRNYGTSRIHALLRDLGERLATDGHKCPGPIVGLARRPDPEQWLVASTDSSCQSLIEGAQPLAIIEGSVY